MGVQELIYYVIIESPTKKKLFTLKEIIKNLGLQLQEKKMIADPCMETVDFDTQIRKL